MGLSREWNLRLNWVLNECIPPYLRDRRWFGALITWLLYRDKYRHFLDFHTQVYEKGEEGIAATYRAIQGARLNRPTDLNAACQARLLHDTVGPNVLEAGCGSGHLAMKLAKNHSVTAVDFALSEHARGGGVAWQEASLTRLPFADHAFDTVISTHVLEHMYDLPTALTELRRVASRQLLVVVPKERPHRYTPSLHLHFFPYEFSLLLAFNPKNCTRLSHYDLENVHGDWYYREVYATA